MNGLRLASMPATDMLDVLHYFFEDDINYSTEEQSKARTQVRNSLYPGLYEKEYKYGSTSQPVEFGESSATSDFGSIDEDEILDPVNPFTKRKAVTPYTPPTDFNPDASNPFGSALDAPLG